MTTLASTASRVTGGSWLLDETAPGSAFTPERLSDEHRLIDQTAAEFIDNEIAPNHDQLETKDWELARRLVRRAGDLGLLGTDVPEAWGGLALDKASTVVVGTRIGHSEEGQPPASATLDLDSWLGDAGQGEAESKVRATIPLTAEWCGDSPATSCQ